MQPGFQTSVVTNSTMLTTKHSGTITNDLPKTQTYTYYTHSLVVVVVVVVGGAPHLRNKADGEGSLLPSLTPIHFSPNLSIFVRPEPVNNPKTSGYLNY